MSNARDEVLEAVATFASGTDLRDWDLLASMLTEDTAAYGVHGADATITRMQQFLGGVGPTQHLLGNHRVTFDGDPTLDGARARVLSYGRVHHVGAGTMEGSFYECMGEYDDTWLRRDGDWLLAARTFDIRIQLGEWAVLRPA